MKMKVWFLYERTFKTFFWKLHLRHLSNGDVHCSRSSCSNHQWGVWMNNQIWWHFQRLWIMAGKNIKQCWIQSAWIYVLEKKRGAQSGNNLKLKSSKCCQSLEELSVTFQLLILILTAFTLSPHPLKYIICLLVLGCSLSSLCTRRILWHHN